MSPFDWIAVSLVVITASARLTRLVTVDKFPPVVWLRNKYEDATDGTGWQRLTLCGYCFSFWATLAVAGSGWATGWHAAWWFVCGALGSSYLAAIMMRFDGDTEDEDAEVLV